MWGGESERAIGRMEVPTGVEGGGKGKGRAAERKSMCVPLYVCPSIIQLVAVHFNLRPLDYVSQAAGKQRRAAPPVCG